MMKITRLAAAVLCICISCTARNSGQHEKQDGTPSVKLETAYDSSTYCFNGTSIVSKDGKWGLCDTLGNVILPANYDKIEFISDDMAVANEGELFYLIDTKGNIMAEALHSGGLTAEEISLWAGKVNERIRKEWDEILDKYEELETLCADRKSSRKAVKSASKELEELLDAATGSMNQAQRARFEMLRNTFSKN